VLPLVAERIAFFRPLSRCNQAVSRTETFSERLNDVALVLVALPLSVVHSASPNCDIFFVFISFKCLIELELEYTGLKDVRTFSSEIVSALKLLPWQLRHHNYLRSRYRQVFYFLIYLQSVQIHSENGVLGSEGG
jgi:hypothetical protein